jgi:hypothetical protein
MPLTLTTIRQYIQDRSNENTSTKGQRVQNRIANQALQALHAAGDWDFDRGLVHLVFEAAKSDGHVSVGAGLGAITGVGTALVAGDVGKFFRFDGEGLQYRCLTRTTALAATCEPYHGATSLSLVDYKLTHDRVALPGRFRKAFSEDHPDDVGGLLEISPSEMAWRRMHERSVSTPMFCAFDGGSDPDDTTGAAPTKYLWVYPSPSSQFVLQIPSLLKPVEMTSDTHGISAPYEAEDSYLALVLAFTMLEQGRQADYSAQITIALASVARDMAHFRARSSHAQKSMMDLDSDEDFVGRRKSVIAKSGETF